MNELQKFIIAFLKTSLGMDEATASKLFKDDGNPVDNALTTVQDLDKTRIKELRDQITYEHDKGYKKGKGEALAALEESLRTKFNVTATDKKGMELIEEIVASAATKASGKEITDDMVKRHPAYIKLQVDKDKELTDKTKELQDKLNDTVTTTQKQERWNKVKAKLLTEFKELKPIESSNPKVADTHMNTFLSELESNYEWDMDASGNVIIKTKDGKLHTNDHGHTVPFKDLVKTTAEKYYEFKAADDRSSGGGSGGSGGGTGGGGGKLDLKTPANADEYLSSMKVISKHPTLSDEDKAKAKDELTTKWQEAKSKMV